MDGNLLKNAQILIISQPCQRRALYSRCTWFSVKGERLWCLWLAVPLSFSILDTTATDLALSSKSFLLKKPIQNLTRSVGFAGEPKDEYSPESAFRHSVVAIGLWVPGQPRKGLNGDSSLRAEIGLSFWPGEGSYENHTYSIIMWGCLCFE